MIISLPLTTNRATEYALILRNWKIDQENTVDFVKKEIVKEYRRSWWNEIFNKGISDEKLFEKNYSEIAMFSQSYYEANMKNKTIIEELTSLLAAHKLAHLTETTSTYTLPDRLIKALNKELENE